MNGPEREYRTVESAIRFIEDSVHDQPTVSEMADAVGLSTSHFHRVFRRWAGITPKRFLQLLTLEHAKRRLDESRTVLDATFEAGLSGPGRLHDLFVGLDGVTPGEYGNGGRGVDIRFGFTETPFGRALVARTGRGVCRLAFVDADTETPELAELREAWPEAELTRDDAVAAETGRAIFDGSDPVPLHVRGTNFQVKVWEALVRIPPGAVVSYGDVARRIGRPEAVRAVAGAVARNRIGYLIPCHRVIRQVGEAGGYHWGRRRKRAMLVWEAARRE